MAQFDSDVESVHSQTSIPSPSQKFVPEEDDEETLWEVEAITAEKGNSYKVKWVGNDPMTMKPWPQSWVPKKDCTPDLVIAWKKKKEQQRRKSTASTRGRSSTVPKATGRASTASSAAPKASTSKLSDARRSSSTVRGHANEEAVPARRGRSSAGSAPATSSNATPAKGRKSQSSSKAAPMPDAIREDDVESEEEVVPASKPTAAAKGKKRKLDEAQSAHNSANVHADVNVDQEGEIVTKRGVSRPKKKRKVKVELVRAKVKREDEDEMRRSMSLSQRTRQVPLREEGEEESYPARKPRSKAVLHAEDEDEEDEDEVEAKTKVQKVKQEVHPEEAEEEEEEEERMVEEVLSQGFNSPPPIEYLPEQPSYETAGGIDGSDIEIGDGVNKFADEPKVDELTEDSSVVIIPKPAASETKKPSTKGKAAAARPPQVVVPPAASKPNTKSTSNQPSSPVKVGPPSRSSRKSVASPSQPTPQTSSVKPRPRPGLLALINKAEELKPQPPARKRPECAVMTATPFRRPDPPSHDSDSDSDSDDKPPPLFFPASSPSSEKSSSRSRYELPREEPSVFWEGRREEDGDGDRVVVPIEERLVPTDLERLHQFDLEIRTQPSVHPDEREEQDVSLPKVKAAAEHETRRDRVEIERDEEAPGKTVIFVPDKSSALMRGLNSNGTRDDGQGSTHPVAAAPITAASAVDAAEVGSTTSSKATKKTNASSKSKSTASNGNGTALRQQRAAKAPSNSYEHDIIPETEAEDSQSQSKSKALGIDLPVPEPTYSTLLHPPPPSTPGGRSTIRSKMRPKTPLSRASSASGVGVGPTGKPLGPIPMLTPSIFHPHLPPLAEPASSLPESISDVPDSARHPSSKISTYVGGDGDGDASLDAIEDFDSPEKPTVRASAGGQRAELVAGRARQRERAEEVWESDVAKRGQEIAEAAKRRAAAAAAGSGEPVGRQKRTLDEIRAGHSRNASNASNGSSVDARKSGGGARGLVHETIVEEEDEEMQDASTAAVPPASGPRAALEEDSATLREMEEAYVDLSGSARKDDSGHAAELPPRIALREEEEESTQDAMQAMMEDVVFQVSKTTSSENAVSQLVLGSKASNDGSENIPQIVVQEPSRPASPRPYSDDGSHMGNMRTTRSRSRSQTPAVFAQKTTGRGKGKEKATNSNVGSKKTSRASSLAPPPPPPRQASPSPKERNDRDVQNRLNAALALLETKAQELAKLEAVLASQRTKHNEEVERLNALSNEQKQNIVGMSETFATERAKWSQEKSDADAKSNQLLAEKTAEWEEERIRLVAQLEAATKSRDSADKDRDFFREQYAQASGYVTSVRDENKDLEKRIKIAEDQAQSGVALIKATFELRVKNLETDLNSWRRMAEFLIEKDKRTDNDGIRRRAAEHPELASLCDRQRQSLEVLGEKIEELEEEKETINRSWAADKVELEQWKKETTRLHVELNEVMTKLDRIGRTADDDQSGDADHSANEFVYCCQWRTYDGVESTSCREVFSTISGLEQHLLSGGHLHRT